MNKKDKKHSGRYTPRLIKPQMKYDEIKEQALEPQEKYDDWLERRDGFRDINYKEWKERDKKKEKRKFPYKTGGRNRTK